MITLVELTADGLLPPFAPDPSGAVRAAFLMHEREGLVDFLGDYVVLHEVLAVANPCAGEAYA